MQESAPILFGFYLTSADQSPYDERSRKPPTHGGTMNDTANTHLPNNPWGAWAPGIGRRILAAL